MNTARKYFLSALEYLETIIVVVATVFIVRTFLIQPFLVSGASMEPNFSSGNYLVINELSYRLRDPARGEVIVFRSPSDDRTFFIKRVVGLPRETVSIEGGVVKINGSPLQETYLPSTTRTRSDVRVTLTEKQYFVMGDNRAESFDSRAWGPLQRDKIIGVASMRLWPINLAEAITVPKY